MLELGKKIKDLRVTKKMTQKDLAKILNVTPQAVSKWERDESNPDIQTLLNISSYFNISVDELLGNKSKSFFEALLGKMKGENAVGNSNIVDRIVDAVTEDVVVEQNGRKKVFIFDITAILTSDRAGSQTQFLVRKLNALMKERNKAIDVQGYTSALIGKLGEKADIIMLAPVYAYAKEEIEKKFPDKPVIAILSRDFGIANVEKIYNSIIEKLPLEA